MERKDKNDEDFDLDLIGHNRRSEEEDSSKEEVYRSLFANGPDDGDGLGRHSVNPTKLTPPPAPGK